MIVSSLSPPTATVDVEARVRNFYDSYGWAGAKEGQRGEDRTYRAFRLAHADYAARSQTRTAALFPANFDRLLIAGCGDMPDSHVTIAAQARHVTCLDLSRSAIEIASARLPGAMAGKVGSILDMPFENGAFDAVFCAHALYHINAEDQARAVEQMIRVTKPGGRVVIVYFNPASPLRAASAAVSLLGRVMGKSARPADGLADAPALYFAAHKLAWWQQFTGNCRVSLLPWEALSSKAERRLLWGEGVARAFYGAARWMEMRAPGLATRAWMFPTVVLDKAC